MCISILQNKSLNLINSVCQDVINDKTEFAQVLENLKILIPGLESPGIFVEVLESPGIWNLDLYF